MPRILYLLPDLDYRGHARQAALLAERLPHDRFQLAVASLSEKNAWRESIAREGIAVYSFAKAHRFDFQHWFELRRVLRTFQPEIIHVWGIEALRTLRYATLLRPGALPPIVLSLPPSWIRGRRLGWWDRRLLSRVSRFVSSCESDRTAMTAAGLPAVKVVTIRPGIPASSPTSASRADFGIPPGPIVMSVGHMQGFGRLMDAFWVAEILSYVLPDLQLAVVGEGDFRPRVLGYFENMPRIASRVHFLGARTDAPELMSLADVVLVPHRRLGGTFTTLEAMAAGKPVVATRLPHLVEIIRDNETGMLANPADQPGLARGCLRLLENDEKQEAMGQAAREMVQHDFTVEEMVHRFAATYDEVLIR